MKFLQFTHKEKKIMVILMLINCFALFVNYFGLSPKFKNGNNYICIFTNSVIAGPAGSGNHLVSYHASHIMKQNFYPFVEFYGKSQYSGFYFNGIFPYYDSSEFMVYTLIIFGFFIIRKILKN